MKHNLCQYSTNDVLSLMLYVLGIVYKCNINYSQHLMEENKQNTCINMIIFEYYELLATKINKIQVIQNEFLRICLKVLRGSWEIAKSTMIWEYLS